MEDVLQLSSFQGRKTECRPVMGDVARLCRDLAEEFDGQAEYQGRIRCDCPATPVPVAYDPRLLRQAVSNLLHNALKYSAVEQPVDLQLSHDEQAIRICVRDSGIGIPPDDIKRIFEPFHRADNVGSISGTGLGLSITKQAIDLHNGTITVESEVGQGTRFTVSFPR